PAPVAEQRDQVLAQRSGRRRVRLGGGPLTVDGVEREALLRRPPAVDRRLPRPGPLGDRVHAHLVDAVLQHQLGCRVEDRQAGPLVTRSAARGSQAHLSSISARVLKNAAMSRWAYPRSRAFVSVLS